MATYTGSDKRLAYLFGRTQNMQGATSESDGAQGIIPKPEAGDNLKFLRGDGEWAEAGGNVHEMELTQEEYDALPEAEKMNGTTYYITDGENPMDEMALGELSDVVITSPQDGQLLKYDAENAEWVNENEQDISGLESRMTAAEGNITSIQNQLVISKSVSGSSVTFTDGANAPLLFCQADIVAVQSGSGDPSPTNVRPIAGFTGCNVTVSPTSDPNDGTVYPISWQTEAGTVYGGTVDFKTGVLTVTWVNKTLRWGDGSNPTAFTSNTRKSFLIDYPCNPQTRASSISDVLPWTEHYTRDIPHFYISTSYTVTYVFMPNDTSADANINICYPIGTPFTYQLTPAQVEALLGTNYISADTGDISLTYLTQPYQAIVDLIRTMT